MGCPSHEDDHIQGFMAPKKLKTTGLQYIIGKDSETHKACSVCANVSVNVCDQRSLAGTWRIL